MVAAFAGTFACVNPSFIMAAQEETTATATRPGWPSTRPACGLDPGRSVEWRDCRIAHEPPRQPAAGPLDRSPRPAAVRPHRDEALRARVRRCDARAPPRGRRDRERPPA